MGAGLELFGRRTTIASEEDTRVDGDHDALILPILLHCVDDQGHPLVQAADAAEVRQLRRRAHADIPVVVETFGRYPRAKRMLLR